MAEQASAQERTEEATPRRRQEARRKGTVARSADLSGAIVLVLLMFVMPAAMGNLGLGFMRGFAIAMATLPATMDHPTLTAFAWRSLEPPLMGLLPIVFTAMVAGLAANFAQVGFVLSTESLSPRLDKLNPMQGFKRLFSMAATVEGLKAAAKSFLFGLLAWTTVQAHWNELVNLSWTTTGGAMAAIGGLLHAIFLKVAIAWLILAALDYFYQRKRTQKQLMMTKDEVRREMKESETSPELKQAQALRRRRLSKGRMMDAVRNADVIVTNPTHYSVALKYEAGKMHAPMVVAKGADYIALKIREVAAEHRVPVIPEPPLARALFRQCEAGDFVPPELFQAVAEILAHVYRTIHGLAEE
ncbi:MAG: flagellar biosynthesis protein FlhB [Fimbriimonadaceae bacterium]|nr:flagellar biosynthesis protein FlhB [Fimbriimonadaceae bacterium]